MPCVIKRNSGINFLCLAQTRNVSNTNFFSANHMHRLGREINFEFHYRSRSERNSVAFPRAVTISSARETPAAKFGHVFRAEERDGGGRKSRQQSDHEAAAIAALADVDDADGECSALGRERRRGAESDPAGGLIARERVSCDDDSSVWCGGID